jgi:hypothetical protein
VTPSARRQSPRNAQIRNPRERTRTRLGRDLANARLGRGGGAGDFPDLLQGSGKSEGGDFGQLVGVAYFRPGFVDSGVFQRWFLLRGERDGSFRDGVCGPDPDT